MNVQLAICGTLQLQGKRDTSRFLACFGGFEPRTGEICDRWARVVRLPAYRSVSD
jgi:hypothetical protein